MIRSHRLFRNDIRQEKTGHSINTLFVSVTQRCNLKCSYCSADASLNSTEDLKLDVALIRLKEWIEHATSTTLNLVLTGGEPTLWGYENLNNLYGYAKKKAHLHKKTLKLGIQSNGTNIGTDFISLCSKFQIEPCLSFDGTPSLNQLHRGFSSNKVIDSLLALKDKDINFAIISCLTKQLAHEIEPALEWFSSNGFTKIRINTLGNSSRANKDDFPDARLIHDCWLKIIGHMASNAPHGLNELNTMQKLYNFNNVRHLNAPNKSGCLAEKCVCGSHLASINPDGNYCMCIEQSMSSPLPTATTLAGLTKVTTKFWENYSGWLECRTCSASPICDNGCVAYHKKDKTLFIQECLANKLLWQSLQTANNYKVLVGTR